MDFLDWYDEQRRLANAQIELFTSGSIALGNGPSMHDDMTTDVVSRLRGWLVELDTLREKYAASAAC